MKNKNFIKLSFLYLFISITSHMLLYHYFVINKVMLKEVAKSTTNIVNAYNKKILKNNLYVKNRFLTNHYSSYANENSFVGFTLDTIDFFSNLDTLNVTVYNSLKEKIVSLDNVKILDIDANKIGIYKRIVNLLDNFFLKDYASNNELNKLLDDKVITHEVQLKKMVEYKNGQKYQKDLVFSYFPIMDNKNFIGKIEIVSDITDEMSYQKIFENQAILIFGIVLMLFFLIIFYNTQYAQKIINQQSNVNKKLLEEKLEAEYDNVAKIEFLANISHELRTPLNAIIGFSDMIISETYGKLENTKYFDYVQDISSAGKHLLNLINDILDYSKAKADKLQVNNIDINLNKTVKSSMRFIKPKADTLGIHLIERVPKETIIVKADPKRLKQAILNLLSNSIKFTKANGHVILQITQDKNMVYVKVIDSGIGIDKKDLSKAFSSFEQIDNKMNRRFEGTGLGLPLTKKLVELIGGELTIQSKTNIGTTATISLKIV